MDKVDECFSRKNTGLVKCLETLLIFVGFCCCFKMFACQTLPYDRLDDKAYTVSFCKP